MFSAAAVILTSPAARAQVRLPVFFSDHMVLQRDRPLPVWGWADKGEKITAQLAGQTKIATADDQGHWSLRFDPLPATKADGAPLTLEIKGNDDILACRDVLVGEVWLCSGQSNMEFHVSRAQDAAQEIAGADNPRIRQFHVPYVGAPEPQDASFLKTGRWDPATPKTAGEFTAAGYFFAREVSRALGGMPVGLINSSWGGTPIESWMPVEAIQATPGHYEALVKGKEKEIADWPKHLEKIEAETRAWEEKAAAAKAAGQPEPPGKPWNPGRPDLPQWNASNLFNGMIHPLLPYAIRGALWYQGEANAAHEKHGADEYTRSQSDMIRGWRAAWGEGDFPFYYVQLPNWQANSASGKSWALFRDAQRAVLDAVPDTGMAVAIDVGTSQDIHPHNKQAVGHRLALLALKHVYAQNIADEGPTFHALRSNGPDDLRVTFDHAPGGLVAKDGTPRHFEVAGEDEVFYPADAVVQGNEVALSGAHVSALVKAVRYAWTDDPAGCNLYNQDGLPAAPFRTDDWEVSTHPAKPPVPAAAAVTPAADAAAKK